MQWHDVLTGKAFQAWIVAVAGGAHVSAGKPLDPFTTSNRRLVRTSEWLRRIEVDGTLGDDRRAEQGIIDLARAKLVDREGERAVLSQLGDAVLSAWHEQDIESDKNEDEIPRALALIIKALEINDIYYMEMVSFWREIRSVYLVSSLFENPSALYLVSYLNQDSNGFNPWTLIKAARADLAQDAANNWETLLADLNTTDPAVSDAVNKFKERLSGWETRAQGRMDFCRALELVSQPVADARAALKEWGLEQDIERKCLNLLSQREFSAPKEQDTALIYSVLKDRYNVVLYGPPGTGKTRSAFEIANHWRSIFGMDSVFNVTFHPSYSYEDFIQGFRPDENDPGTFRLEDGILLRAARAAEAAMTEDEDDSRKFLVLIDEINRGDTARIFGELITYIEPDKRNVPFHLAQGSKGARTIPSNLYFLGTMNTADKSISLLDVALRRRFAFIASPPKPEVFSSSPEFLNEINGIYLNKLLESLNARLRDQGIEKDRSLGHALLKIMPDSQHPIIKLREKLRYDIFPLISEYCYMNPSAIKKVMGGLVSEDGDWLEHEQDQFIDALKELSGDLYITEVEASESSTH